MKIVFLAFLAILALNALVILGIVGMLMVDHVKARRRRATQESTEDAHANVS